MAPAVRNSLRARLLTNNKDGVTADAVIKHVTVERGALVIAERTPRAGPTTKWAVFSSVPTHFLSLLLRAVLTLISSDPSLLHALCPSLTEGTAEVDGEVVMRIGAAWGILSQCLPLLCSPVS